MAKEVEEMDSGERSGKEVGNENLHAKFTQSLVAAFFLIWLDELCAT